MTETWKRAPGLAGAHYQVSDHGRVMRSGRILKTPPDGTGYPQVNLYVLGKRTHTTVHVLVLTAFAGPCPPGLEARHLNDVKTDNRWPENLCWGTRPENQGQDRLANGTSNRGERHGLHKLTEAEVLEIRQRWNDGELIIDLATAFGRSRQCINHVVRRTRWAWFEDEELSKL